MGPILLLARRPQRETGQGLGVLVGGCYRHSCCELLISKPPRFQACPDMSFPISSPPPHKPMSPLPSLTSDVCREVLPVITPAALLVSLSNPTNLMLGLTLASASPEPTDRSCRNCLSGPLLGLLARRQLHFTESLTHCHPWDRL